MFSKDTYIQRRKKLKEHFTSGLLFFIGNDESPMNYEANPYHFRQDSTFLYYFGLKNPGLFAIMDLDNEKDIIFGEDFTMDDFVWMGYQPPVSEKCKEVGINHTDTLNNLRAVLLEAKDKGRPVHFLPPYRPEHQVKLLTYLGVFPGQEKDSASIDLVQAIGEQRIVKTENEIVELEKAADITSDMHRAAMQFAQPGMKEAEVMAKVHEIALAAGGNISFPIIATKNGQTLHNHYHGNTIQEGDLFLLDAGAETPLGYAGDMSSTFPVGKHFTSEQKEIYQVALNAHNAALEMLKPGVNFKDVHLEAARKVTEGLKTLGFMKGNVDDAVAEGAHALFFPCGLGHLLGLDAHDMENLGEQHIGYEGRPKSKQFGLKSLRLARKLKPGFVITIEPGVYFIPQLIDSWKESGMNKDFINFEKVEAYKNFGGIRNEEDVLITSTGYRVLGKPLAKSIKEVETERSKAF